MDPLSTVASGFAVISLAFQLTGTVQDIHRLLRGISDAPKELERLVDILEQLHCILDGIRVLQLKQENQDGIPDMHPSVIGALESCQSQLKLLECIVDKFRDNSKRSRKAFRMWASLKLTLKKRDVDEFENRIKQAINILQMAMTMDMAHVQ